MANYLASAVTMKSLRAIGSCLLLFVGTAAWSGPPSTYQNEKIALIEAIDHVLIEHGHCQDRNDCRKKKRAFAGRTSTGVDVEVYQVTDAQAIQKILTACASSYAKNQQQMDVSLSMYRQPHEELMGFGKWHKKPFVSMHMKGEQQ